MELPLFLKYLTFTRWSKLLAAIFASIFCIIVSVNFMFFQHTYEQKKWEFKNALFISHGLTLQAKRLYKISWEEPNLIIPSVMKINDIECHPLNFFHVPNEKATCTYYCRLYFRTPFYVKVFKDTYFEMSFVRHTSVTDNQDQVKKNTELFSKMLDPVASYNWTVEDITDAFLPVELDIDGEFPVFPR